MCRHTWNVYTSLWKSLRSWNAVSIVLYTIGTRQKRIRFPWKLFEGISCCFEQIRGKSYHWKLETFSGTKLRNETNLIEGSLDYRKVAQWKSVIRSFSFFRKKFRLASIWCESLLLHTFFSFFFFFLFIRRPRAWCGYKVATRGTWRHSRADRPISVAATVSNIMQASESHLKCKYLQRE